MFRQSLSSRSAFFLLVVQRTSRCSWFFWNPESFCQVAHASPLVQWVFSPIAFSCNGANEPLNPRRGRQRQMQKWQEFMSNVPLSVCITNSPAPSGHSPGKAQSTLDVPTCLQHLVTLSWDGPSFSARGPLEQQCCDADSPHELMGLVCQRLPRRRCNSTPPTMALFMRPNLDNKILSRQYIFMNRNTFAKKVQRVLKVHRLSLPVGNLTKDLGTDAAGGGKHASTQFRGETSKARRQRASRHGSRIHGKLEASRLAQSPPPKFGLGGTHFHFNGTCVWLFCRLFSCCTIGCCGITGRFGWIFALHGITVVGCPSLLRF